MDEFALEIGHRLLLTHEIAQQVAATQHRLPVGTPLLVVSVEPSGGVDAAVVTAVSSDDLGCSFEIDYSAALRAHRLYQRLYALDLPSPPTGGWLWSDYSPTIRETFSPLERARLRVLFATDPAAAWRMFISKAQSEL